MEAVSDHASDFRVPTSVGIDEGAGRCGLNRVQDAVHFCPGCQNIGICRRGELDGLFWLVEVVVEYAEAFALVSEQAFTDFGFNALCVHAEKPAVEVV